MLPYRMSNPVPDLVNDPVPLLIVVFELPEPIVRVLPAAKAVPAAGITTAAEPFVVMTSSFEAVPNAKAPVMVALPVELSKSRPPGSVVKPRVPPRFRAAPPVNLSVLTVPLALVLALPAIE